MIHPMVRVVWCFDWCRKRKVLFIYVMHGFGYGMKWIMVCDCGAGLWVNRIPFILIMRCGLISKVLMPDGIEWPSACRSSWTSGRCGDDYVEDDIDHGFLVFLLAGAHPRP